VLAFALDGLMGRRFPRRLGMHVRGIGRRHPAGCGAAARHALPETGAIGRRAHRAWASTRLRPAGARPGGGLALDLELEPDVPQCRFRTLAAQESPTTGPISPLGAELYAASLSDELFVEIASRVRTRARVPLRGSHGG
jgi:hypothetical protein